MSARALMAGIVFLALLPTVATAAQQSTATTPARKGAQAANERFARMFHAWDENHDGMLTLAEFESGWRAAGQRVEAIDASLRTQFSTVDKDANHGLDATEYATLQLVRQAGSHAPPMSDFDVNRDGRLEYREYLGFVERMSARRKATSRAVPKGK